MFLKDNKCMNCDGNCKTCITESTNCITCPDNLPLLYGSKCVAACPSNYFSYCFDFNNLNF